MFTLADVLLNMNRDIFSGHVSKILLKFTHGFISSSRTWDIFLMNSLDDKKFTIHLLLVNFSCIVTTERNRIYSLFMKLFFFYCPILIDIYKTNSANIFTETKIFVLYDSVFYFQSLAKNALLKNPG